MTKILLIEDNAEMRENTAEILELSDYEVITASHGKQGVEIAKKEIPDLIICDIMMPEMDGYGVIHALSKNAETAGIPFIFLTAKTENTDFRKGMNLGADDYITKPFDDLELLKAIEIRLKKKDALIESLMNEIQDLGKFSTNDSSLEDLTQAANLKNTKKFKKKQFIFYEGDQPKGLYFIKSGKIKMVRMNEDGKEYILDVLKEGNFLGYSNLFDDSEYNYAAVSLEEVEVSLILKDDFFYLLNKDPNVGAQFIKILATNLRESEDKLLELAYNTVRKRVADTLVKLGAKYKKENSDEISFNMTRDDLASMIGTATETVIRTLSEFKEDGIIHVKGGTISILNMDELENIKY